MTKLFLLLAGTAALAVFAGCAPFDPDAPPGDHQQLGPPGSFSAPARGNPLDAPDEATLPHVPGQ